MGRIRPHYISVRCHCEWRFKSEEQVPTSLREGGSPDAHMGRRAIRLCVLEGRDGVVPRGEIAFTGVQYGCHSEYIKVFV